MAADVAADHTALADAGVDVAPEIARWPVFDTWRIVLDGGAPPRSPMVLLLRDLLRSLAVVDEIGNGGACELGPHGISARVTASGGRAIREPPWGPRRAAISPASRSGANTRRTCTGSAFVLPPSSSELTPAPVLGGEVGDHVHGEGEPGVGRGRHRQSLTDRYRRGYDIDRRADPVPGAVR